MEESAPQNLPPKDDIMTPQDSLEGTTQMNVTPTAGTSLDAGGSAAPQQPAQSRDLVQISDGGGTDVAEAELPTRRFGEFWHNRLIRRVGLASGILMGLIAILVVGTLIFQKTHKVSLSQAEKIAQIQDQSVKLKDATTTAGPASLRVGVSTLFVNGDVSVQGVIRLNNGSSYGQFDSSQVSGSQTYKLPNSSGTICLDSGNCSFASASALAAVQNAASSAGAAAGAAQATALATQYIGGSGIAVTGSIITNSGVLSVNGSVGAINLQGTANQIAITNTDGTISLALPQDIGLASTPTFGGLVLTSVGTQNGFNLCDSSNNCSYGINSIIQGGNGFGTDVIVGANDNSGLQLITNNTTRLRITNNGVITLGGANSDRITALAQFSGGTPLVFQGASDDFFTTSLVITNPTSNRNIILPNADGTVCLSSGNCSGAGGYGDVLNGGNNFNATANIGTNDNFALNLKTNNLTRITVSNTGATTLLGNVTSAADVILGTNSSNRLTINSQISGATPFIFQGATNDSFTTTFSITDPDANRNITFPNADGTVCLSSGNCTGPVGTGDVLQGGNNFGGTMTLGTNDNYGFNLKTNNTNRLTISNTGAAAFTGDLSVVGNNVFGTNSANRITFNGQVLGGSPLVFQGATDNAFATFLLVADPTATRTITLPNADGTICLSSGNCTNSGGNGDINNGGNNFNSTISIGANDNFGLDLKTNNTTRLSITNAGVVTVQGTFIANSHSLLGGQTSDTVTFQAQNIFAPNDLNIDTYTQYIDTTNNQVGFGTLPLGTARVSILAPNAGDGLTVNNGLSAGAIANFQDNGVNVVTIANEGAATFRNSSNSVAAFQVQNAAGATIVNTDTTTRTLNVNGGPSTYTFTPSGPVLGATVGYTGGTRPFAVVAANFNGDAFPDLASANAGSGNVSVLMNNGNGTFANKVDYTVNGGAPISPLYLAAADFNSDGRDDIVSANVSTSTVSVLMNNGNGTFAAAVDYAGGTGPRKVTTGDFNADGKPDIAISNSTTNISVLINNGNGTFAAAVAYATTAGKTPNGIVATDVNQDGNQDLVVADEVVGTSSFSVFLGNGNGTFQAKVDYNTAASGTQDVKAADFNGDGYPDLVFGVYYNNIISVYINNGNGTFGSRVDYTTAAQSQYVATADFNGDGIKDLVSSNYNGASLSLLLGNGNGTFQNKVDYPIAAALGSVAAADFNQDGKQDVVVGDVASTAIRVKLGNGSSTTVKNSLSVTTVNAVDTALYIKAAVGQSADLLRVTDSNGNNAILGLSGTGALYIKNTTDSTAALQLQNVAGTNVLTADTTNSKVGINLGNLVTPSNTFTVNGITTADSLAQVAIGTNATTNKGLVIQGIASQTADLFQTQTSAGTVTASIGATGATLFKNSADSTAAFQVQNAAGTNALAVDTSNLKVSLANYTSVLGAWTLSGNNLLGTRYNGTAGVYNGYVYLVGNEADVAPSYAKLNSDGTTGAWTASGSLLPARRAASAGVVANGYYYLLGGTDLSGKVSTVLYSKLNSDGTMGAWQTAANALPQALSNGAAVTANGYLYHLGGTNGAAINTIYYAKLNADGSVGAWQTSANALPANRSAGSATVANGYVYYVGGNNQSTVYYAALNSDGTTGVWQTNANALPAVRNNDQGLVAFAGSLYYFGGSDAGGTSQSTVYYATLNVDGSANAWATSGFALPNIRAQHSTVVGNGFAYVIGSVGAPSNTVYYTKLPGAQTGLTVTQTQTNIYNNIAVMNADGSQFINADISNDTLTVSGATTVKSVNSAAVALTVQGAAGQTADLQRWQDSTGTVVASLSGAGSATLGATAASSGLGTLTQNSPSLPDNFSLGASVSVNGYIYAIGGSNGAAKNTVYYGKLNANGSVSSWTTSGSTLPVALFQLNATVTNGYIYAIGGTNGGGTTVATVYYSKVNTDGTLGAWTATTALPAARSNTAVASANGYVYVVGGFNAAVAQNTVYYAQTNSDGTLGAWTTSGNTLPAIRAAAGYGTANGFMYVIGGSNGTTSQNTVYYAALNSDGTVGTWTTSGSTLPGTRSGPAVIANNNVFILGGTTAGVPQSSIYATTLNGDGTVNAWTTATATVPLSIYQTTAVAANGYAYLFGGYDGTTLYGRMYYARMPGLSTGAVINSTATNVYGSLQIQNADGSSLLTANNLTNTITVGAPSENPTLFVLGTKTSAGDPAGTNGAMYYNTVSSKFRCYANGAWGDCQGAAGAGTGDVNNGGNAYTANMVLGTTDNFGLSFITNNQTRLSVTNTGFVGINNATSGNPLAVNTPTTADALAQLLVSTNAATNKGLVIQKAVSQTASPFQIQNSTGTVSVDIDASGNYSGPSASLTTNLTIGAVANATAGAIRLQNAAQINFRNAANSANVVVLQMDAADQTVINGTAGVFLGYNGTNSLRTISGGVRVGNNLTGTAGTVENFRVNLPTTIDNAANVIIGTSAATSKGLVVQGSASQTANLQEWQDSTGAVLGKVTAAGSLQFAAIGSVPSIYGNSASDNGIEGHSSSSLASKASVLAQPLAANSRGLIVKGATGQTANLQEWQTITGLILGSVSANGSVLHQNSTDSTTAFQIQNAAGTDLFNVDTTNNQIKIGGAASATPTLLVLADGNVGSDPTGTNGAIYYNSSMGKFRCYQNSGWTNCIGASGGGSGTGDVNQGGNNYGAPMVVGTTDAQPLSLITNNLAWLRIGTGGAVSVNSAGAAGTVENFRVNTPGTVDNAASTILTAGSSSSKALVVQGAASQSVNIFEVSSSSNTPMIDVTSTGILQAQKSAQVYSGAAATVGLIVQGAASQSANLQEWQSNGGTALAYVNSVGDLNINHAGNNMLNINSTNSGAALINFGAGGTGPVLRYDPVNGSVLQVLTAGSERLRVNATGVLEVASTGATGTVEKLRVNTPTTVDNLANVIIGTSATTSKGLVIQGAASQSANLQEWQDSLGNKLLTVSPAGSLTFANSATQLRTDNPVISMGGQSTLDIAASNVRLMINGNPTNYVSLRADGRNTFGVSNAAYTALTVVGFASQTANLQEWQNSAGVPLTSVGSDGKLSIYSDATHSSYLQSRGTGGLLIRSATAASIDIQPDSALNLATTTAGNVTIGRSDTDIPVLIRGATTLNNAFSPSTVTLKVKGAASQTADLLQLQTSAGSTVASFNNNGVLDLSAASGTAPAGAGITLGDKISLGSAGSYTNSYGLGLQNNALVLYAGNSASATISLRAAANGGQFSNGGDSFTFNPTTGAQVNNIQSTSAVGLTVKGAASQVADLQQWQNSSGTPLAAVGANGTLSFNNLGSATSAVDITSGGVGTASILLGANAGYIQKWLGSGNDNVLVTVAPNATVGTPTQSGGLILLGTSYWNGSAAVSENLQLQSQRNSTNAGDYFLQVSGGIKIYNQYSGAVATIVRGASGQVAHLQEWQNYAGIVLASIDASGNMTLSNGNLNIATGKLQVAGVDRIDNSGNLVNVTFNGNTIGVGYGGTGATTFTANGLLFGNGTGAVQATTAGSAGQCLLSGGGSAPSWGSCVPSGGGGINQGGNAFGSAVTIGATDNYGFNILANNTAVARFTASGQATFQNGADSVTAMQVQNAAGTSLFTVDSTNSRVYIGNPTADGTGTLLVLDAKNTGGDPTGVDGGMYYNSNLGKFRCYEDGSWKDCIYNVRTSSKTADQTFSSTSYADVSDLSFSVLASKVYKLNCTLLVSVPSGTNGGNLSTNGPASPSQLTATFAKSLDQSSGDNYATSSSYDDASAATTFKVNTVSTGSNRFIVSYNAILVNGANNGTWSLRSKAFDGSSSITMYANSSCDLRPL